MTAGPNKDWDPGAYAKFRALRLRPALDLLAQVPELPAGDVIDLGCGDGAAGPPLRRAYPGRRIVGVDASPAMLGGAEATGSYAQLVAADAATWAPVTPPALIFSNALIQWLPHHDTLLPALTRRLAPGGALAVQMPRQQLAPSHALIRQVSASLFPNRFDWSGWSPPVAGPRDYHRLLAPLGVMSVWETEYLQRLDAAGTGHAVRHFTGSTAVRPVYDRLSDAEAAQFDTAYDDALADAYPPESDGSVLFPFRRLFFVLTV